MNLLHKITCPLKVCSCYFSWFCLMSQTCSFQFISFPFTFSCTGCCPKQKWHLCILVSLMQSQGRQKAIKLTFLHLLVISSLCCCQWWMNVCVQINLFGAYLWRNVHCLGMMISGNFMSEELQFIIQPFSAGNDF